MSKNIKNGSISEFRRSIPRKIYDDFKDEFKMKLSVEIFDATCVKLGILIEQKTDTGKEFKVLSPNFSAFGRNQFMPNAGRNAMVQYYTQSFKYLYELVEFAHFRAIEESSIRARSDADK